MRCVRQNRSARRGVLLLVVLSLLVLMSMIALAFVMMTGQARRVSNSQSRAERASNADPAKQLDAAFLQTLRGTNNKNSAIHESLLEDMYGPGVPVTIVSNPPTSPAWVPAGAAPTQLLDVKVTGPPATQDGYYNGCVFTAIVNGMPQSTRIVGYHYDSATGDKSLRVLTFDGMTQTTQIGSTAALINGRPFSGTGFGNYERRTDAATGKTSESLDVYSLLPNVKGFVLVSGQSNEDYDATDAQNMLLAYTNAGNQTIPSLHRPDLIHWWLHKLYDGVIPQPQAGSIKLPDGTPWAIKWPNNFSESDKWATVFNPLIAIPSRPLNDSVTQRTILAVKKAIICRPLRELNPAFTGSNADSVMPFVLDPASKKLARYWELFGNWDVDSDGDGVPDSIWVDLGFPVQTGPDGRLYKPLFAIHCLDMDGRLNVNAHGGIAHVDPSYVDSLVAPSDASKPQYRKQLAGAAIQIAEPRGMGYGTADISLANLFAGASNPHPDWLLGGNKDDIVDGAGRVIYSKYFYEGRYGESGEPFVDKNGNGVYDLSELFTDTNGNGVYDPCRTANLPYPGASGKLPPFPGDTGTSLLPLGQSGPGRLGRMKQFEALLLNAGTAQLDSPFDRSSYASPHDLYGAGTVLLDRRGQPLNLGMGFPVVDVIHTPYELDLSRRAVRATRSANSVDSPFTPAELERVLRPFDVDAAALPTRLAALLNPAGANPNPLHRLVTTDSYDVPTPFMLATREMRQTGTNTTARSLVDLYTERLRKDMAAKSPPPAQLEQAVQRELRKMFAAEWMAGLKLDINRPFGNGSDDGKSGVFEKNGVVDEPAEFAAAQESAWGGVFPGGRPVAFDASNGQSGGISAMASYPPGELPPGIVARQQMARQIFALLLLLRNDQSLFGSDSNGDGNITEIETKDTLAQWAINAVDFRDRDSTMTPFEYDRNPWDGWDVDGDPRTPDPQAGINRGLVWGCERPELLIDEGFAMHDRRTEDLDNPEKKTTDPDPTKRDDDYDQRLRPQGSLFVELYNPWSGLQEMPPGEFDFDQVKGWRQGVWLDKRNAAGDPVWRMLIVRGQRKFADPDDPFLGLRPRAAYTAAQFTPSTEVERSVYFAGAPGRVTGHGLPYFGDPTKLAFIPPGRYAVIGPAAKTMIGRRTDVQDDPTNPDPMASVLLKYNETRQIVLTPGPLPDANAVQVLNNGGEPALNDLPRAVAVVIDKVPDPAAPNDPTKSLPARLSISEPLGTSWDPFYPTTAAQGWDPNAVKDGANPAEGAWTTPKDEPLDAKRQGDFPELAKNKTLPNFRVIHLQRLADPSLPWNPEPQTEAGQPNPAYNANLLFNPYLTIDSAPVDLTCFNGVTNDAGDPQAGGDDDPARTGFASHQRGETNENEASPRNINNLWRQELPRTKLPSTAAGAAPGHYFDMQFAHTLGYLNGPYWSAGASGKYFTNTTAPSDKLRDIEIRGRRVLAFYAGAPTDIPFRWLNWNNRPYISAHELLLVPKARSSRLLGEYPRLAVTAPGAPVRAGYADAPPPVPPPLVPPTNPFNHLLNFFDAASSRPQGSAHLYRLFDYVGVPSRWVGTETMLNLGMNEPYTDSNNNGMWDPTESYMDTNGNGRCDNVPNDWDYWSMVRAPFNKVSNYRDPGAINVNTVSDWRVWEAIFHGDAESVSSPANRHPGPLFSHLQWSRRGYVPPAGGLPFDVNKDFPSIFMRPFRSAGSGSLGLYVDQAQNAIQADIEVTLMRPDPSPDPAFKDTPLFRFMSPDLANDPARNPYYAYQALRRNSNLLTTRSNVYAVWMTVGRFEVQPATNRGTPQFTPAEMRALYPDGYELGPELGSETGEIVRHRAFYLLDRTIPVGFRVGEDLNVERAVLVKRYIE